MKHYLDFQMSWEYFQLFLHISTRFNQYSIRHNDFVQLSAMKFYDQVSHPLASLDKSLFTQFIRKLHTKSSLDYSKLSQYCQILSDINFNIMQSPHHYRSSGLLLNLVRLVQGEALGRFEYILIWSVCLDGIQEIR